MTVLGTYAPTGQFAFNRNYVAGLDFRFNPVTAFSLVGHTYTFLDIPAGVFVAVAIYDPILFWSSNTYTLDHVFTSSIFRTPPTGPDIDLPFTLRLEFDPVGFGYWLTYRPFGDTGSQHYRFPFTLAPSGYWMQPWWS